MKIRFTKMHGLGNDFVVLDAVRGHFVPNAAQARFLADRHFGVGCDQILVVQRPSRPDVDFRYRIFNADGSEVEQCGNGARCFARFVADSHLSEKREIRVETKSGIIAPRLEDDGSVTVDMGVPRFAPDEIPFVSDSDAAEQPLDVNGRSLSISAVSMGNPHAVFFVSDVTTVPLADIGPLIEHHPVFPRRTNVEFAQVLNRARVRMRVWERGAGVTLACGTGACAMVVAGILNTLLDPIVQVQLDGGELTIRWTDTASPVWMTGPAVEVFNGTIALDEHV